MDQDDFKEILWRHFDPHNKFTRIWKQSTSFKVTHAKDEFEDEQIKAVK